jgi:hypothetical protein
LKAKLAELVIEWVINTLKNNPEDWYMDGRCYLAHKSGTKVWVANDWWGVNIEEKEFRLSYDGPDSYYQKYKRRYPGFWEILFCRQKPEDWRSRIWTAYEEWLAQKDAEKIMDWVKTR